jgi:hypothetical protein
MGTHRWLKDVSRANTICSGAWRRVLAMVFVTCTLAGGARHCMIRFARLPLGHVLQVERCYSNKFWQPTTLMNLAQVSIEVR